MPVYLLREEVLFPPVDHAVNGLLAVGGDLSPERLLAAYCEGIFPWYSEGEPILWHSPDPRYVVTSESFRVPRRLERSMRAGSRFRLYMDTAFEEVIAACASVPRPGQRGTWITTEMMEAYIRLHQMGFAHSVEARESEGAELVGGVYGVSLGGVFFGESMFARMKDASKVAFVALGRQLHRWGIGLVDCQVETPHLARFGAVTISRQEYLELLRGALEQETLRGKWQFDREL